MPLVVLDYILQLKRYKQGKNGGRLLSYLEDYKEFQPDNSNIVCSNTKTL